MMKMLRAILALVMVANLAPADARMFFDPASSAFRLPGLSRGIPLATPSVGGLPSGATAIWYADQVNTTNTRAYVPNEVTKGSRPVPLMVNNPESDPRNWSSSNVTSVTTKALDSRNRPRAARVVTAGNWFFTSSDVYAFDAAKTYTAVYPMKTTSGTATVLSSEGFGTPAGGASTSFSVTTTWTRFTRTISPGATSTQPFTLSGVSAADLVLGKPELYEGSVDPMAGSYVGGGHLLLGQDAKSKKPTIAAGVLDFSGGQAQAVSIFDNPFDVGGTVASFTDIHVVSKTVQATGSDIHRLAAANSTDSYGDLDEDAIWQNGYGFNIASFQPNGYKEAFIPGVGQTLANYYNTGFNDWAFRYDATTGNSQILVNGVVIYGSVVNIFTPAIPARTLYGLFLGIVGTEAGAKWAATVHYERALSRAELAQASTALRGRATTNGLTLDTSSAVTVMYDGDSNFSGIAGTAPGGRTAPYLLKTASGMPAHRAFVWALGGNRITELVARVDNLVLATPKAGQKIAYVSMIGTNDETGGQEPGQYANPYATQTAAIDAYIAALGRLKAAGYGPIVPVLMPARTDSNVSPNLASMRAEMATRLAAAVGVQIDDWVDIRTDSLIGSASAPDNTTYFIDKVHLTLGSGDTGHGRLTTLIAAKLAPLLGGAITSDTTPSAFTVAAKNNQPALSPVTSDPITLTGYDTPAPYAFTGGLKLSLDGGSTFTAAGSVPVGATFVLQASAGGGGNTTNYNVSIGGTSTTWSITAAADSGGGGGVSDPVAIFGAKLLAWYDDTDPNTMYSDAGSTKINPTGNVAARSVYRQLAKTPSNPTGDSAFYRQSPGQGYGLPYYDATAYNAGQAPGLVVPDASRPMRTPNVSITGYTGTLSRMFAFQSDPAIGGVLYGAGNRAFNSNDDTDGNEQQYTAYPSGSYTGPGDAGTTVDNTTAATGEVSYDGTTKYAYVNGSLVASAPFTQALADPVDFDHFYDGAVNGDGSTLSGGGHATNGFVGVEQQHVILKSAATSQERAAFEAFATAKKGSTTTQIDLSSVAAPTTGQMTNGSTTLTTAAAGPANGRQVIVLPQQQDPAAGPVMGPGGVWPSANAATDSAVLALTFSRRGQYIRAADSNKVYKAKDTRSRFVGSRTGTTMNVTSVTSGSVGPGGDVSRGTDNQEAYIPGTSATGGYIVAQTSGTPGGVGTYTMSTSEELPSQAIDVLGGGGYFAWDSNLYYERYAIPLPLVTNVVSGGGTTNLVLADAAQTAVPAGTIVEENVRPLVSAALTGPAGQTFQISAGTFAWTGGPIVLTSKNNWTIKGSGVDVTVLKAVQGGSGNMFRFVQSTSPTIRDMTMDGGHNYNQRMGLDYVGANSFGSYGTLIQATNCTDTFFFNLKLRNAAQQAYQIGLAFRGSRQFADGTTPFTGQAADGNLKPLAYLVQNVRIEDDRAEQRYIAWKGQVSDSGNADNPVYGEFRDVSFDGNVMVGAIESFQSVGTIITRFSSRNGFMAMNSSAGAYIKDATLVFEANARDTTVLDKVFTQPLINLNNNVANSNGGYAGTGTGGVVEGLNMEIKGWADASGVVFPAIGITAQPGWTIKGNYIPTVKDDGQRRGLIKVVVAKNGVADIYSAHGPRIVGASQSTMVTGMRMLAVPITGSGPYPPGEDDIYIGNDGAEQGSSATNNISGIDTPLIGSATLTKSGNISNNAYGALQ